MKEITILNRTVRLEEWGISYKADNKHMERIISGAGLPEDSKGLVCPGVNEEPRSEEEDK